MQGTVSLLFGRVREVLNVVIRCENLDQSLETNMGGKVFYCAVLGRQAAITEYFQLPT